MTRSPIAASFTGASVSAAVWSSVSALALVVLAATPVSAAVVHDRWEVEIRASDEVVERRTLTVQVLDADDVEAWRRVPVLIDDHRELVRAKGFVVGPDGERDKIGRRDRDESQLMAAGMLHLSQRIVWLEPENLVPGSRLEIETEVRERPYFPSGILALGSDDDLVTVEARVRVAPGIENWRWRLEGDVDGLTATEITTGSAAGVEIRGLLDGSSFEVPELAVPRRPLLRWGWQRAGEWSQVARWYRGLLTAVPRDDASVRALAAELTSAERTPRQRLDEVLAFVRAQVRYVAVEVGVGGYRPSPPAETLERRWGDCKDKSFLLLDLLRAVGLEAHPVLIRLDRWRAVDPTWPDALHFNHLIVAVETEGLEIADTDPVAGSLLFIDPTQTVGGAAYLHAGLHGRQGLVIRDDHGDLVELPVRPSLDSTRFEVDLDLAADGSTRGTAVLRLAGDAAVPWLTGSRNLIRSEVDDAVRSLFKAQVPTATLGAVRWRTEEADVPTAVLEADIEASSDASRAGGGSSWLVPPGPRLTPEVRKIDEVLAIEDDPRASWPVREVQSTVRLRLPPESCGVRPREREVTGAAGRWSHVVESGPEPIDGVERQVVTIRRGGVVERPWLAGADAGQALADLRAMAVAEQRALKRRLRSACP